MKNSQKDFSKQLFNKRINSINNLTSTNKDPLLKSNDIEYVTKIKSNINFLTNELTVLFNNDRDLDLNSFYKYNGSIYQLAKITNNLRKLSEKLNLKHDFKNKYIMLLDTLSSWSDYDEQK